MAIALSESADVLSDIPDWKLRCVYIVLRIF